MYQPCSDDEHCTSTRCKILQTSDDIIFAFFAIEMCIKMLAMGMTGAKNAYLTDAWNRLDFIIVVAGALEYCLDVGNMNLSAIRTVRVLRPLRAINRIPSMRILVMLLLDTLPMLGNVLLLCFFVFFIFGIIGVQLWAGLLRQRCHLDLPFGVTIPDGSIASYYQNEDGDKDWICSMDKDNGMHRCNNLPPARYYHLTCEEPARPLPYTNEPNDTSCVNWNQYYTKCQAGDNNPFQDAISFDNVGMAWTAIFLVISLEGWSDIMYYVQDAHSFWSWIYFVLLIVIGSFFMINLCLVVIATQFSETKKREMERMRQERARCHSLSTLASYSVTEQLNCYAALIHYLGHLLRKLQRKAPIWYAKHFRKRRNARKNKNSRINETRGSTRCCVCCNSVRYRNVPIQERFTSPETIIKHNKRQGSQRQCPNPTNNNDNNDNNNNNSKSDSNITNNNPSIINERNIVPDSQLIDCQQSSSTNNCQTNIQVQNYNKQNESVIAIENEMLSPKMVKYNRLQIMSPLIQKSQSKCSVIERVSLNHGLIVGDNEEEEEEENGDLSNRSYRTNRHCSAPNLYAHYHHHHHHPNHNYSPNDSQQQQQQQYNVFPESSNNKKQRAEPSSTYVDNGTKLPACDMIISIRDNELHNSTIRLTNRGGLAQHHHRKLSQGTISWNSSSFVVNEQQNDGTSLKRSGNGHQPRSRHQHHHHHRCNHHHHQHHHRNSNSSVLSGRSRQSRRASSATSSIIACKKCCCQHKTSSCLIKMWERFRRVLQILVNHNYFKRAIFLAILFNTFSMGIEYHNQPESLSHAVEISNAIFTAIFCCEMVLKLASDGICKYVQSGFNVFDGTIVILSLLELLEEHGSGLSVLRTFRLLRILKLVRFMPALRRQLVIMLRTIDNVAVFFALLLLFIFIFSILGMNLFGCKFCRRNPIDNTMQCDRKNFDSLLWALVTVFQILTQEDWNVVLFNGMERTSPYAALYFVALMTFGNYVLFNLLVAILVEGFSQEDERKESMSLEDEKAEQVKQERLIYFYGPNDDLEREIQTLHNPQAQSLVKSNTLGSNIGPNEMMARSARSSNESKIIPEFNITGSGQTTTGFNGGGGGKGSGEMSLGLLPLPPIITHTAATPQGSPPNISLQPMAYYLEKGSGLGVNDFECQLNRSTLCVNQLGESSAEHFSRPHKSMLSVFDNKTTTTTTTTAAAAAAAGAAATGSADRKKSISQLLMSDFLTCGNNGPESVSRRSSISLKETTFGMINKLIRGNSTDGVTPLSTNDKRSRARWPPERPVPELEKLRADNAKQCVMVDGITFPLRRELSCNQIRSSFDEMTHDVDKTKDLEAKPKNASLKQRRQSFFSKAKQSSICDEKDSQLNHQQRQQSQEEMSSCPIYAKRNVVLRRKSVFASIGHQSSICEPNDNEDDDDDMEQIEHQQHQQHQQQQQQQQQSQCEISTTPIERPTTIALTNIESAANSGMINIGSATFIHQSYLTSNNNNTLSPTMNLARKNSMIHEIRELSPRNSLGGVFYSSSVITVKNSNSNDNELYRLDEQQQQQEDNIEQQQQQQQQMDMETKNGYVQRLKTNVDIERIRKFCIYFKWTSWMSEREEHSLFVFSTNNRIRQYCSWLADHPHFDYIVLIFISLNCITLAMERPKIPPWSREREFLSFANYVFTFVFGLEMLIKVIAKGLFYGSDAYFHNGWNIMDGSLVGISLFDIFLSFFAQRSPRIFGILRVFRLLRSLRPLRVINRAPGLKLVVQTLLSSLRPIGNIVLICCTFFIIFGILGVQLFKGSFYYCDGPKSRFAHNKTECLSDPRNTWINRKYNFDNLGQALMSLFVLSSKDGWVNIMYTGLDAVGVDQQPIENYNEWRLLYFISFLLLVAFFVLNMFVGVVVENFHRCRREQEQEEKALRALKRAQKMEKRRKKMREPPYFIGYGKFRMWIHRIVTGKYFDLVIALVIGLNVITMSLEHYMMPMELVYALKLFNFIFASVFVIEAFMKAIALGIRRYLKDKWNQLDVIIVLLSILGIILEEMESTLIPINPTIIRVMRVARIARVLKLLKMAKGIRQLLDTVMQALPQVGNLGLLFFLLFFIFAALGTELFGRLECDEEHPCQGLGEHAHFQNFGMAFLTLFRVATGDNWNGIMKDTLRDKCDPTSDCLKNCCISPIIAPMYFVIFVLMAQFVLVNVVVAVLMKHLEESHKQMDEDEDHVIDLEIAKEIEAEKKALIEAIERRKRDQTLKVRRPLMKMASLPSNFTFSDLSTPNEEHSTIEMVNRNSMVNGNGFDIVHNISQRTYQSPERIELEPSIFKCKKKMKKNSSNGLECPLTLKTSKTCESLTSNKSLDCGKHLLLMERCQESSNMNEPNNQFVDNNNDDDNNNSCHHHQQSPSSQPPGILRKSHSLRIRNINKGTLIDTLKKKKSSFKRNRKHNQCEMGRNVNGNRYHQHGHNQNEDERTFLTNLNENEFDDNEDCNNDDEDEDGNDDDDDRNHIQMSRSSDAISSLCRRRKGDIVGRNNHSSNNSFNVKFNSELTFNCKCGDGDEPIKTAIAINAPVTITIDNYHETNDGNGGIVHWTQSHHHPLPPPPSQSFPHHYHQTQSNESNQLLSTFTVPTTETSSPSRNGSVHRKLSDFLDEESAPLSPGIFTVYPEFIADVSNYEDDLNVLDEYDEPQDQQLSLASAESWPSGGEVIGESGVILDMTGMIDSDSSQNVDSGQLNLQSRPSV